MGEKKFWKIHIAGANHPDFIPHDLEYFSNRFLCEALRKNWEVPPARLINAKKRYADFYGWHKRAPIVSGRARDLIGKIAGENIEFLPFHSVRLQSTTVMNVLACANILDLNRTSLEVFGERYFFRKGIAGSVPPLFKCPGVWGEIFVTEELANAFVDNKITGLALADPEEATMPLILSRAVINRFPGLIE